jgi:hypothetical protein
MTKYRTEKFEVTYDVEQSYGETPDGVITANRLLGVFEEANLPSPKFDYQFIWGMNPVARNWMTVYRGKAQSQGSISNILLLDGRSAYLPISNFIKHGTSGPYYTHKMIDTIKLPSFRINVTRVDDNEVSTPDTLSRWWVGGKIQTGTFKCEEGKPLMMDLNAQFKMPYFYNTSGVGSSLDNWYRTGATRSNISSHLDEYCGSPYYFSQCTITGKWPIHGLSSVTMNAIRNWKLEVNNNLEPRYYLSVEDEKVPFQIWEGRRDYTMSMTVDLIDQGAGFTKDTPWVELLNQGGYNGNKTEITGAAFDIKFAKSANDYIEFMTPANTSGYSRTGGGDGGWATPTCGGNSQGSILIGAPETIGGTGIVSITMEIKCRTLQINVMDSLASTSYPTLLNT